MKPTLDDLIKELPLLRAYDGTDPQYIQKQLEHATDYLIALRECDKILNEIGAALEERGYFHMTNGDCIGSLLDELDNTCRLFPMQYGPPIPWYVAAVIYQAYAAEFPGAARQQSLERMGERGGFGWAEVAMLYKSSRGGPILKAEGRQLMRLRRKPA